MEGLIGYCRRLSGEYPDRDDYRAAAEREQRGLEITKAGPDVSG